tara:strand:- start:42 stop:353 length:312 start_codon:yes stop_codon:yes gene_type:complete
MKFDHVALVSKDIKKSVEWYEKNMFAKTLYIDETWALIDVAGTKVAFVLSRQHPAHICFEVGDDYIGENLPNKKFKKHRDGTESCYVADCDGNFIEFLKCRKT